MELSRINNGTIIYGADGIVEISAGKKFRIKASGDNVLLETVPEGKKWTVTISLKIEEGNL